MKKTRQLRLSNECPCGKRLPYERCCARWHHGPQRLQAPDAETLMRSRYSAFVYDELAYLLETWDVTTRPVSLEPNPEGIKWLGLQVRRHTVQDDAHAVVEFVARSRLDGKASRLHETSRFIRRDGRWYYVDGDIHG